MRTGCNSKSGMSKFMNMILALYILADSHLSEHSAVVQFVLFRHSMK